MSDNKLVDASIILIAIVFLGFILKTFDSFLRPFAIAIILTLLLIPLFRYTDKKKIPKFITYIGIILLFSGIIYLLVLFISQENQKINQNIPIYENTIDNTIQIIADKTSFNYDEINIKKLFDSVDISVLIKSIIQGVLGLGSELFIALIFTIFLIPSHKKLVETLNKNLDKKSFKKFSSALSNIEKSIRDYLYTKTLISLGTAIISGLILMMFKTDFIWILATFIFILNFIPNVGSFIAVFLAIIVYALKMGLGINVFWLLLLLTLVQLLFGNIIEPKFTGDKLKLSPIIILLSLFIWFYIWGIIGMMLAVPLTSILKITLEHIDSTKNIGGMLS